MFSYDFTVAFIFFGILYGLIGWASIEFVLWLFSFIHISFG